MTGGLAYLLRDSVRSDWNGHSVRVATPDFHEERWIRRILRRHLQLTVSPRAARLLSYAQLPLVRVEPVQPPCSVEETWAAILSRLARYDAQNFEPRAHVASEGSIVM